MDFSDIEQAIKDAINGLGKPYIKNVASYGGEFDEELAEVVRRFPGVWVTFGGAGRATRFTNRDKWLVPVTFVVMVGAKNMRNEEATRHGVKNAEGKQIEVGTYQLWRDVRQALMGNDLGLSGVDVFEPGQVRTLYNVKLNKEAISVLAIEWHTKVQMDKPESAKDANESWLLRTNMDFLFQPDGEAKNLQAVVELDGDDGSFADGRHSGDGDAESG